MNRILLADETILLLLERTLVSIGNIDYALGVELAPTITLLVPGGSV